MSDRLDARGAGDPGEWPNEELRASDADFDLESSMDLEPEWFADALDDALDADERARCEDMLAQDPQLAARFEAYRSSVQSLRALGATEKQMNGGSALRARLLETAARELPAPAPRSASRFAWISSVSIAAASVALFFALREGDVRGPRSDASASVVLDSSLDPDRRIEGGGAESGDAELAFETSKTKRSTRGAPEEAREGMVRRFRARTGETFKELELDAETVDESEEGAFESAPGQAPKELEEKVADASRNDAVAKPGVKRALRTGSKTEQELRAEILRLREELARGKDARGGRKALRAAPPESEAARREVLAMRRAGATASDLAKKVEDIGKQAARSEDSKDKTAFEGGIPQKRRAKRRGDSKLAAVNKSAAKKAATPPPAAKTARDARDDALSAGAPSLYTGPGSWARGPGGSSTPGPSGPSSPGPAAPSGSPGRAGPTTGGLPHESGRGRFVGVVKRGRDTAESKLGLRERGQEPLLAMSVLSLALEAHELPQLRALLAKRKIKTEDFKVDKRMLQFASSAPAKTALATNPAQLRQQASLGDVMLMRLAASEQDLVGGTAELLGRKSWKPSTETLVASANSLSVMERERAQQLKLGGYLLDRPGAGADTRGKSSSRETKGDLKLGVGGGGGGAFGAKAGQKRAPGRSPSPSSPSESADKSVLASKTSREKGSNEKGATEKGANEKSPIKMDDADPVADRKVADRQRDEIGAATKKLAKKSPVDKLAKTTSNVAGKKIVRKSLSGKRLDRLAYLEELTRVSTAAGEKVLLLYIRLKGAVTVNEPRKKPELKAAEKAEGPSPKPRRTPKKSK